MATKAVMLITCLDARN